MTTQTKPKLTTATGNKDTSRKSFRCWNNYIPFYLTVVDVAVVEKIVAEHILQLFQWVRSHFLKTLVVRQACRSSMFAATVQSFFSWKTPRAYKHQGIPRQYYVQTAEGKAPRHSYIWSQADRSLGVFDLAHSATEKLIHEMKC